MQNKFIDILKKIFYSFAWIAVLVFIADIVTKWSFQNALKTDGSSFTIINNFLYITLEHNLGAALSLGYGLRWLWIIVSVTLSTGLIFYYVKQFKKLSRIYLICLSLMIGGAVGNMIDRCFYWESIVGFDGVIDWVSFQFGSYYFPTFNIADSALVIGVAILIIVMVIELIQDAIKKNKEGAYSLKPKEYEAKMAKEEEENKEKTQENNEKN